MGRRKKHKLQQEVKKHIVLLFLFLFSLILLLSVFGQAGVVGVFLDKILSKIFGIGKYFAPILIILITFIYFRLIVIPREKLVIGGLLIIFFSFLGLFHYFHPLAEMKELAQQGSAGGYLGYFLAYTLIKLIGSVVALFFLLALFLVGAMLLLNTPLLNLIFKSREWLTAGWRREKSAVGSQSKSTSVQNEIASEISPGLAEQYPQTSLLDNNHSENITGGVSDSLLTNQSAKEETKKNKKKKGLWQRIISSFRRQSVKKEPGEENIKSIKFEGEDENQVGATQILTESGVLSSREKTAKSEETVQSTATKASGRNKRMESARGFNQGKTSKQKLVDLKTGGRQTPSEKTQLIAKKQKGFFWRQPPLNIFKKSRQSVGKTNVEESVRIIQQTLQEFGIKVEPAGYNIGPTVTQYAFSPPPGVKLSRIVSLQSNLALRLASPAIRIEAPIPGTSLIGVEVPNKAPTMIRLGDLLAADEFKENNSRLSIVLGKDVNGNTIVASLEKMPHVLVAGSTNTGKSVCINAILSALLFKNSPQDLQLILVDPKRVELSFYNGIPHLLTKVITDMNKVVNALKWATIEMDNRYKLLEEIGAKNIVSYNQKVKSGRTRQVVDPESGESREEELQSMPYIVIVIDELADLMATHGKEVEGLIVRLSQMARAVGIHLILSTQRPDTNVITGTIKNNIPARIAFKVASQIDSRTILDSTGAEKLLGNGDMLYLGPGYPQPVRIQGPFVSETETRRLISYIKKQAEKIGFDQDGELQNSLESKLAEKVMAGDVLEGESSADDELYQEAKELVIQAGKASISAIQRRLRIGYNRAARIMDLLAENGIVGPENGSRPREVLVSKEEELVEVAVGPEDDLEVQEARDRREF